MAMHLFLGGDVQGLDEDTSDQVGYPTDVAVLLLHCHQQLLNLQHDGFWLACVWAACVVQTLLRHATHFLPVSNIHRHDLTAANVAFELIKLVLTPACQHHLCTILLGQLMREIASNAAAAAIIFGQVSSYSNLALCSIKWHRTAQHRFAMQLTWHRRQHILQAESPR